MLFPTVGSYLSHNSFPINTWLDLCDGIPYLYGVHMCACKFDLDLYLRRCVQIYVFVHNVSLVTHFYCYDELGPEPKPVLPGDTRTYRIWLDPNQYQQDMEKTAKGEAEDVYESLNVIMRRKPKENNFKVSLSHSRKSKRGICPLHYFAVTHGGDLQYLQTFFVSGLSKP